MKLCRSYRQRGDGETSFTLDNHTYTGADFKRFAASYPRSLKMQLEAFTVKSVLDYENSRLEEKYPAFRLLMQEYKEGMLLFEISNREVWERAVADEAGQAAYLLLINRIIITKNRVIKVLWYIVPTKRWLKK